MLHRTRMATTLADRREDLHRCSAGMRLARSVSITMTLDWIDDEGVDDRQVQVVPDNLADMRGVGNTIVIGTGLFRQTARVEARAVLYRSRSS
jgi:hypothetical protein